MVYIRERERERKRAGRVRREKDIEGEKIRGNDNEECGVNYEVGSYGEKSLEENRSGEKHGRLHPQNSQQGNVI